MKGDDWVRTCPPLLRQAGFFAFTLCFWSPAASAQSESLWYLTWGYNRAAYTCSDVHIVGDGPHGPFNLTFEAAEANDMPERFQPQVYFHPGFFTIPQFNVRVGRSLGGGVKVGLGWDHMKYKLSDQTLAVTGTAAAGDLAEANHLTALDVEASESLNLNDAAIFWGKGFNFEHSDGVNFVRISLESERSFLTRGAASLRGFGMASMGVAVCSTDFTWAGNRTKNPQHLSGFGASVHGGFRLYANSHLFLQCTGQTGALVLPWIRIQGPGEARADQRFVFVEGAFAIGYTWGFTGSAHQP